MKIQTISMTMIPFLVVGCSTAQPCEPMTVKVPVAVSCVKSAPIRPASPLDELSESSTDFEKIQALTVDWALQRQYINEIEAIVEGCR